MKRLIKKAIREICRPKVKIVEISNSPLGQANSLEGKVALVTDGSRGIGLVVSKKLYASGAKVILAGRDEKHLQSVMAYFSDDSRAKYMAWDVTCLTELNEMVARAIGFWGQIDILVNCTGTIGNVMTTVEQFFEETEENFDLVMDTNLKSLYFLIQRISQEMLARKTKGYIINIASMVGLRPNNNPYHISKWGVTGLTKGMGKLLAPYGIIVNGIAAGLVATDMMGFRTEDSQQRNDSPDERWAIPDDIASIVLFLVSGYGNHIVGEVISCDGDSCLNRI